MGFNVLGDDDRMWLNLGGWGNTQHAIEQGAADGHGLASRQIPGRIETDRWYDVRVEVGRRNVRCYLDGKLILDSEYPQPRTLYAVAGLNKNADEVILKVVNAAPLAQPCGIDLAGAETVQPSAESIVLTSEKPTDENSLDEPLKVAPVTRTIQIPGKQFDHAFPANSVTILRLKIGR